MASSRPMSVRGLLRAATQELHQEVDGMIRSIDPFCDVETYARFLAALLRARDEVGSVLGPDATSQAWDERAHVDDDRLGSDLAELGLVVDRLPPGAPGGSSRWGALYVFEGSRLGARVLSREARERLGSAVPTRFLGASSDDRGSGERWRWFCVDIESVNSVSPCVDGANAAFAIFRSRIGELGVGSGKGSGKVVR